MIVASMAVTLDSTARRRRTRAVREAQRQYFDPVLAGILLTLSFIGPTMTFGAKVEPVLVFRLNCSRNRLGLCSSLFTKVEPEGSPATLSPLRRQNPREKPGALAAQAWSSDLTVPGTDWVYAVLSANGRPAQCEVELALPNGTKKRLIKFAILAKGSRTIALLDEYIERPVRDSVGWKQGKSFNVVLFPKDSIRIDAEGTAIDEEMLLIDLPQNSEL